MEQSTFHFLINSVLRSRATPCCSFEDTVSTGLLLDLCDSVHPIFASESALLQLPPPIVLVGDIHGNIDDLLRIFERCGYPPSQHYCFLGDYVDRGTNSIEVLTLLFALKCKFPNHVHLLRGNHETSAIASSYGFSNECKQRFSGMLFTEFSTVFEVLPLAAVIGDSIFCVHGGLSPDLGNIEDINNISRPLRTLSGIAADLLWSDPEPSAQGFEESKRGLGHVFDLESAIEFLEFNKLKMIVRSHESCMNGMTWPFGEKNQSVLTIFSTTDYCGDGNSGVVARFAEDLELEKVQFEVINEEARKMRRVFFPVWLLEEKVTVSSIVQLESDLDSQPEDGISQEFETAFTC